MRHYVSKAMRGLRNSAAWVKENPGDALRYAALPIGGIAGGLSYAITGDAATAQHYMFPAALMFGLGEASNLGKALAYPMNLIEKVGAIASAVAPAAASLLMLQPNYQPAFLGMLPAWGLAKGVEAAGRKMEENRIAKEYLDEGRDFMLDAVRELPDGEIARVLAKNAKRKR